MANNACIMFEVNASRVFHFCRNENCSLEQVNEEELQPPSLYMLCLALAWLFLEIFIDE